MVATRRRFAFGGVLLASAVLCCALGPMGPAMAGDDTMRFSGTVVAIDAPGATVTIEELGAAPTPTSTPAPRTHTIQLAPATAIRLLQRQPGADSGWSGGFAATPMAASDLRPGDFATVLLDRRDARTVASSIDVIRPPAVSRSSIERVASSAPSAPRP
jgi:hypothetical protein